MNIYIEKNNEQLVLKKKLSGSELLRELKINPSSIILVKNDFIVLEDEILEENDNVKILSVISGG